MFALPSCLQRFGLGLLALAACPQQLPAHFLFIHLVRGPLPRIELHFAESAWDLSVNQQMIEILAGARAWRPGGEALTCESRPFGLVAPLAPQQDAACAALTFGLLDRGEPFLLEYYAKGIGHLTAGATASGLAAEILAEPIADAEGRLRLTILFNGRPAPGAEVVVPTAGTFTDTVTADGDGRVEIDAPATPVFALRAMIREERQGEHEGQSFNLVKHYTTLTVHDLARAPADCDSLAWGLLMDARHCCASNQPLDSHWRANFDSIIGDERVQGQVGGGAAGVTATPVGDAAAVAEQLQLLSWPPDPGTLDGEPVGFAEGRIAGDAVHIQTANAQLHFTVADRRLASVRRNNANGAEHLEVTDWKLTHEDRLLPKQLALVSFDADQAILSVALFERRYTELGDVQFIERQHGTMIRSSAPIVEASIRFTDIETIVANPSSAAPRRSP
ncbi:MAG: hypothetical protein AAF628_05260 [Planctomycetota bacterium]